MVFTSKGQIALDPPTMKMINTIAPLRHLDQISDLDSQFIAMSNQLKNEIYQSVLNYSNVLLALNSHLLNCLAGVVYLSFPRLETITNLSPSWTQSCLEFCQRCLEEIYLSECSLLCQN
jgi:hypothetical protein